MMRFPALSTVRVAMLVFGATLLLGAVPRARPAGAAPAEWTQVGSYQPPITRYGAAMVRDRSGRIILFGGITTGSIGLQEVAGQVAARRLVKVH